MTALFRDNYIETLKLLSKEQLEQIKETNKDYICLNVQVCNAGAWIDLTLTDDWSEIEEDFNNGVTYLSLMKQNVENLKVGLD